MYPTCATEKGWLKLSTGFPLGSEQSQLPCNNMYLLEEAHAKIFAPTDPVIVFTPLKGVLLLGQKLLNLFLKCHRKENCLPSSWHDLESMKSPLLGSPCLIIMAVISGNSLVFGMTILILCLFVSIHGNMNKQRETTVPGSVMPPLCHLPYKFYSVCSCLFLLLACSARV